MEDEKMRKEFVAGEMIYYGEDARDGMYYLQRDLQRTEAEVFIIAARERGQADFEDDHEGQFTLSRTKGKYILTTR